MIGKLVEEVLDSVRAEQQTKLAQHTAVKTAQDRPRGAYPLTDLLCKLAEQIENVSDNVTVAELKQFVGSK